MTVPTIKLNNGVEMPLEGFGVFQIPEFEECKQAVLTALSVGYRSIDTAQSYHNEDAVGAAITESSVARSDIFLTTKIWPTHFGYAATKKSVEDSLRKLQTDYLDLVLLHRPYNDYYGAYRALEDLATAGTIRAIGISNFSANRYVDLATFNKTVPAIMQSETHVFYQQNYNRKYLKQLGTQLESWGPFAEGQNGIFTNPILADAAAAHHKTTAQVALRFLTQQKIIVIPKSTHKERMIENLDIWDFDLTESEMAAIKTLDQERTFFEDRESPETVANLKKILP